MVSFLHYLILVAGESMTGEEESDFWAFDLNSKQWQQVYPKGLDLLPRKGHSCLVYEPESLLLIFGGVAKGNYLNDFLVFRLVASQKSLILISSRNEFEVLGDLPEPREGSSFVVVDRHPMISSGCNYKESVCFGDLFFLTLANSEILITKVSLALPEQEKVLIIPAVHQFFVIPGHSKSNKQGKKTLAVSCSTACSTNGVLINELCICNPQFFGESCEFKCVHGSFKAGVCVCESGFASPECEYAEPLNLLQDHSSSLCSHNCHNRGTCLNNECHCLPEYFGSSCELKYCSSNCGSDRFRGVCDHSSGVCQCQNGFGGPHCQFECPQGCPSGHQCGEDGNCFCEHCPEHDCSERGTLVNGVCHCLAGFCGVTCESPCETCHGHGRLNGDHCQCFDGYFGLACQSSCPSLCSGNGKCKEGFCDCFTGWEGEDCGTRNKCQSCVNGRCIDGKCRCFKGFSGDSCDDEVCPKNCTVISFHYEVRGTTVQVYQSLEDVPGENRQSVVEVIMTAGICSPESKSCQCFPGYSGEDCSKTNICDLCIHGTCENQKCRCFEGFSGEFCDSNHCPSSCSGHGECLSGRCSCFPLWSGPDCSTCLCKQGSCLANRCECFKGFEGQLCEVRTCDKCLHGVCADFFCHCEEGYSGKHCEVCTDPELCFSCLKDSDCGSGRCFDRTCKCPERFFGKHCENSECSAHGRLKHGACICDEGFSGKDCSLVMSCPNSCSFHGICHLGKCYCEPEYTQDDCSAFKTCPDNCNFKGRCIRGKCFCFSGYTGPSCLPEKTCKDCSCPCLSGKCLCEALEDQSSNMIQSECQENCNNHGQCIQRTCVCDENWQGQYCEVLLILDNSRFCMSNGKECSGHGLCNNGRCFCQTGFSGELCEKAFCANCSDIHQTCVNGKCQCLEGWSGVQCSVPDNCFTKDCGQFGACVSGQCLCDFGFASDGLSPCSPAVVELGAVALVVSAVYGLVMLTVLRLNPHK